MAIPALRPDVLAGLLAVAGLARRHATASVEEVALAPRQERPRLEKLNQAGRVVGQEPVAVGLLVFRLPFPAAAGPEVLQTAVPV